MNKQTAVFHLNLLYSKRARDFFKIPSDAITKIKDFGAFNSPKHHWLSNWRVEVYYSYNEEQEAHLIVTNERSRYNFLTRSKAGDYTTFVQEVQNRLLDLLDKYCIYYPSPLAFRALFLSGLAPSVTAYQNDMKFTLDRMVDRMDEVFLEDLEEGMNRHPSVSLPEIFPEDYFCKLMKENAPFTLP